MFWWLDFNPQMLNGWDVRWPWSGAVTQDITSSLLSRAGSGRVEKRVLDEVASYGRQIGVLSELVHDLVGGLSEEELTPRARQARAQLTDYQARIDRIKEDEQRRMVPEDPEAARRLLQALLVRHQQLSQTTSERELSSPS